MALWKLVRSSLIVALAAVAAGTFALRALGRSRGPCGSRPTPVATLQSRATATPASDAASPTPSPGATMRPPAPLSATEAAGAVGRTRTVCGTVASARYLALSWQRPTFLNLDRPHPDAPFTIVIRRADRARFAEPPERAFVGRRICATGTIEIFHGRVEMIAREPAQIRLDPGDAR